MLQFIVKVSCFLELGESTLLIWNLVQSMQKEIEKHTRLLEEPQELPLRDGPSFIPTLNLDNSALSPRQRPVDDDSRRQRPSVQTSYFRPVVSSPLNLSQRRLGSIGGPNSGPSSSLHPSHIQPMDRPQRRPLSGLQPPPSQMSRRHTSADIRLQGWNPPGSSPFSQPANTQWGNSTSSRSRPPEKMNKTSQMFANYEIEQGTSPNSKSSQFLTPASRRSPPSSFFDHANSIPESTWSFATATKSSNNMSKLDPPPPPMDSRRSSVVSSSVHALLNPSGAQEPEAHSGHNSSHSNHSDEGINCEPSSDDRKRKRSSA